MSNPSLIPVVETVVDSKVQAGELFTAHDITLEVRNRGHRAGHSDVRDAVHDYYGRGGFGVAYSRTIISVPAGNPYLYHRGADDPSTYHIRGNTSHVSSPTTISVPAFGQSGSDDDDDDDSSGQSIIIPSNLLSGLQVQNSGIASFGKNGHVRNSATRIINKPGSTKSRIVDQRGTLSIPATIIRQTGFKPRQKVYAVAATNGVNITATKPSEDTVYGTYTVDAHQQVRVTQALLQRAGIAGNQYDVEQGSDNVIVKLAK